MEFDLDSNMLVDKQHLIDWSFIGNSLLSPDMSKIFSDVDALGPLPETIIDPYDDHNVSHYPVTATNVASDQFCHNMIRWNNNFFTFTSNDEILEPAPLTPSVSDELKAASYYVDVDAKQENASTLNGFISNQIFPWNMNSVMLSNNENFNVVPPFSALVSNIDTKMNNSEIFMDNTLPDQHSTTEIDNKMQELREATERNETGKSRLASISYDEIKKYFSVPITRVAKELNVGLTILKRRCRELGIPRWPHRKIKSLKSLISNVQELGKESATESVINELQMLENHKKLMEDNPEIQLTERTKKLRQACFKANYKKRRARASSHRYY